MGFSRLQGSHRSTTSRVAKKALVISLFAEKDLPEPGVPRIRPLGFFSFDDNPLGVKSDFILSLCELIMGSRNGIEAEEKSVIDRCLPIVYRKYFENPVPENGSSAFSCPP